MLARCSRECIVRRVHSHFARLQQRIAARINATKRKHGTRKRSQAINIIPSRERVERWMEEDPIRTIRAVTRTLRREHLERGFIVAAIAQHKTHERLPERIVARWIG